MMTGTMKDLMVDIETLGKKPGSAILSIGAVEFNAETGEMGAEFYTGIELASTAKAGLAVDAETILWWMRQSKEAQEAAFSGTETLVKALTDFSAFLCPYTDETPRHERLWAKPPSFDAVLLEAAYHACNWDAPWSFRQWRDCRTLFDLAKVKQPDIGTVHNARSQAIATIEAYRVLGFSRQKEDQKQEPAPADNVTAVLRKAVTRHFGADECLAGYIYADKKGRFRDGEYVNTSRIVSRKGDVFETVSSVYLVASWMSDNG